MALVYQSSYKAAMLLLVGLLFLQASSPALCSNGKTCYSRQHRDAIVDVRIAVEHNGAITSSRVKQAEKDCILACCSEEVEPGIKCNMVVYKPSSQTGTDNCYLFHCETEQDCPLVAAKPGINTYDISKDVIHPTAKGNGRMTVMPIIPVGSVLDKAKGSQMTWRNSLVAIVVVTLICLTLVLAIVGRKAMESFDRRHYTRLELNDLHYEI
ncbi:hypothetical protein AOLI_G00180570 [Acnodon oligacanthus]